MYNWSPPNSQACPFLPILFQHGRSFFRFLGIGVLSLNFHNAGLINFEKPLETASLVVQCTQLHFRVREMSFRFPQAPAAPPQEKHVAPDQGFSQVGLSVFSFSLILHNIQFTCLQRFRGSNLKPETCAKSGTFRNLAKPVLPSRLK